MNETHDCPGCGKDDRVQAVPAVYLAGRDAVTSRERNRDGDMRTVTRTVTTGLSDALAPVPEPPTYALGCLGLLAAAVAVVTFLVGVFGGHWFEDEPDPEPMAGWSAFPGPSAEPGPDFAALGWVSGTALLVAVLVFALLLRRRTAFERLTRRRHHAEELWARGWYCHRCGTAHFAGASGRDRVPLTLQQFRERVWEAGGYGDEAARQRAVDPVRR